MRAVDEPTAMDPLKPAESKGYDSRSGCFGRKERTSGRGKTRSVARRTGDHRGDQVASASGILVGVARAGEEPCPTSR